MVLDARLDFNLYLKNEQNTVNKTIGIFCKLQNTLSRTSLITTFKSFIRPHLDYRDIIYDRAYNTSFHQNIKSIQYNVALAIFKFYRKRHFLVINLASEVLQDEDIS